MKHSMKVISLLCVLNLASCGDDGGGSSSSVSRQERQQDEGNYRAIIRPLNYSISGWIPNGKMDIRIIEDSFEVKGWMDDSSNVTHLQNVHFGTKCPTAESDSNQDGFVDFNEALKVTRQILIPLDGNLATQLDGERGYPKGNYAYSQKTSLSALMNDLMARDGNDLDSIGKLKDDEGLNLEGRVILIHGAADNRALPASVSTAPGLSHQASMPIACGVIERMPNTGAPQ